MRSWNWLGLSVALVMLAGPRPSQAQGLSIELMTGSAYNVPTPLTVRQDGFPDIRLTARYDTKPFGPYAPYYSWRVGVWRDDRAWEFQQVHHRLFLANTTAEVEVFDLHYGYNYFLLGRAWRKSGLVFHASGGVVITSPTNRIRGESLNTRQQSALDVGYHMSGVGAEVAVSRQLALSKHVSVLVDVSLLAASASVPVVHGSADVPNLSVHGHVGLGLNFGSF